jgi:hypothetical protein
MNTVVMFAVNALLAALSPEMVKTAIRKAVAKLQAYVAKTENKLDDAFIPASNLVLLAFDVPGPNGEVDVSAELRKLFDILKEQKTLFLDMLLDEVEDHFAEGSTADEIAEKAAGFVRMVLNVPDNDPVTADMEAEVDRLNEEGE